MIISAAVKFKLAAGNEIIMPVHRHGDAYSIMRMLGFKPPQDFATVAQGFVAYSVDPEDPFCGIEIFLNRREALDYAKKVRQVISTIDDDELYSEDLW